MTRGDKKREIELPAWAQEQPWYQEEANAAMVPVSEPERPWYLEEVEQRNAVLVAPERDQTEQRYFRQLISLVDDRGWSQTKIREAVSKWLSFQDHYRFVAMVRPDAQDWVEALIELGVKPDMAQTIRAAIETDLIR